MGEKLIKNQIYSFLVVWIKIINVLILCENWLLKKNMLVWFILILLGYLLKNDMIMKWFIYQIYKVLLYMEGDIKIKIKKLF